MMPDNNSPINVIVVGGGTAGWLAANILNQRLNTPSRRLINIILIESKTIGRIGVGEATVPLLKETLLSLGIDEYEFMRRTNATFKHAIRYDNWRFNPAEGKSDTYYHPFENFNAARRNASHRYYGQIETLLHYSQNDVTNYWWHRAQTGRPQSFAHDIGIQPYLCDALRAPKTADMPPYQSEIAYAYHLDAQLFADYLAEVGVGLGVRHVVDDVTAVTLTEQGAVASVRTRESGEFTGDFFVDCTGFAALLIDKALRVPFVNYNQHLLCDRAIAIPTAPAPPNPRPYTSATAADAGWICEIDLTSRSGNGYVFSSSFTSDDEAERYLRRYLGSRADGVDALKVRMTAGRREEMWRKNCVAIGLAGGFVEPIESTGIMFITIGANWLADFFPVRGELPQAVTRYNSIMASQYDEIRDFIVLHYCLSQRDDTPFWREVRKAARIPESLAEKLELWRHVLPRPLHFRELLQIYDHRNYECILFGMGWRPNITSGRQGLCQPRDVDELNRLVQASARRATAELPSHADVLRQINRAHNSPSELLTSLSCGRLNPGIALVNLAADPRRILLSGGTCTAIEAQLDEARYKTGARVPKGPWRPPTSEEHAILSDTKNIAGHGSFISVFRVDTDLLAKLRPIGEEAATLELFHDRPRFDGEKERSIELLVRELGISYSEPNSIYRGEGVTVNKPGMATATFDLADGRLPGLHLDNWSALSPIRRDEAYNRMCVNIGCETRKLLFINLSMRRIVQILSAFDPNIANEHPTKIGRQFMARFPEYPVVAIDVAPGEGYIAPTENVIHDGTTAKMTKADVILTLIGRFRPLPVTLEPRTPVRPGATPAMPALNLSALLGDRLGVAKPN